MCRPQNSILEKIDTKGGGEYVIDIKNVSEKIKVDIILSVIHEKGGVDFIRIWRLLQDKGKMEDKQVKPF